MSAVSAGLAATITEWFSENEEKTSAIETAEKVNVPEVKARAKKKTRKKSPDKKKESTENGDVEVLDVDQASLKQIGRKLDVPSKAKMSGPRVIRIEEPEPEREPRKPKQPSVTPAAKVGAGVQTPQQTPDQDSSKGSRRNKRRTAGATKQSERGSKNPIPNVDKKQCKLEKTRPS